MRRCHDEDSNSTRPALCEDECENNISHVLCTGEFILPATSKHHLVSVMADIDWATKPRR